MKFSTVAGSTSPRSVSSEVSASTRRAGSRCSCAAVTGAPSLLRAPIRCSLSCGRLQIRLVKGGGGGERLGAGGPQLGRAALPPVHPPPGLAAAGGRAVVGGPRALGRGARFPPP